VRHRHAAARAAAAVDARHRRTFIAMRIRGLILASVAAGLTLGLCGPAAGAGADASSLAMAARDVEGDGWRAEGVSVTLTEGDGGVGAILRIAALLLPAPLGALRGIEAACPRIAVTPTHLRCDELRLGGTEALAAWPTMVGSLEYRRADGVLRWQAAVVGPGEGTGGRLDLTAAVGTADRSVSLELRGMALEPWAERWRDLRSDEAAVAGELALAGRVDLDLDLTVPARGPAALAGEGRALGLSGNNPSGTRAAEGVDLDFSFRLIEDEDAGGWRFAARLGAAAGEVYLQPVYANLSDHAVTADVSGLASASAVEIAAVRFEQAGVGSGRGRGVLAADASGAWRLEAADLFLDELSLPGAYDVLMQPFLAGTDLGDLETLGSAAAVLRVVDGRVRAGSLALDELYLDDRSGRLAVYGLDGDLAVGDSADERPIRLAWDGGYLYGFPYGRAELQFQRRDAGLALAGPVSIPVLDGALEINQLEVGLATENRASAVLDARLTPVDMRAVALALDWPPLSGTLSGRLPRLSYRDGLLALGGEFEAEVFDGTVRIRDFSVTEPFRPGARLRAEMDIERLDLRQVTEAFSFGLITGRLDGYVHGLTMIDWQPVAFDARLFTSPRDPGSRRISQRAVDNIASLGGGGGAAALSSGFMRFFEDFAYRRLALGCRRELDVCHMSGIEPRGNGYLILEGRGLPRITVVGYAREVSWSTLTNQLAAILASGGPVVE
jgi:hypothetical protein